MAVLEVKNFSWAYQGFNTPLLKNISFSINKGEFVGLIGRVSSGRSSLCTAFLGLIPHFYPGTMTGDIIIDGLSVKNSRIADLSTRVGLVFQSPVNQLSGAGTTVEEELAFGLENLGVHRSEIIKRVDSMLKLIGLEAFRKRSPFELSGGQQQKVAIASVLIMEPKILVMDEPTAQLDPLGSRLVFDLIKQLSRKGITILLNTQDINHLAEFADRILVMAEGRIVRDGTTRDVLTDVDFLRSHGVFASDLTLLSLELRKKGLYKGPLCLNLSDAERMVRRLK